MGKSKKILSVFLVALFVSYYVGVSFFPHTHVYGWGTVTHSHPYTSNTHTHSAYALQFIHHLNSNFQFVSVAVVLYFAILTVSNALFCIIETRTATFQYLTGNQLRAPPVLA